MGILNSITSLVGLSSTISPDNTQPLTLGAWLEQNNKSAEDIINYSYLLIRVVQALLNDKGINAPTALQTNETRFGIAAAIKSGDYEGFVSPINPHLLNVESSNNSAAGNVFYEREVYSPESLTPKNLTLNRHHLKQLNQGYSNGLLGKIIAGTLVRSADRCNHDFSHTYGDKTWSNYLATWNMLHSIPRGEFINNLDVNLIGETNRLIHAEKPSSPSLFSGVLRSLIAENPTTPGRIREHQARTETSGVTREELANIKASGADFVGFPSFSGDFHEGMIEHPAPDTIEPRLQSLVEALKSEAAKEEGGDIIGAASQFCRHLIALHPYEDSNAQTALIIMNRILSDYGFAPAILTREEKALTLSDSRWRNDILEGIAHTNRYLEKTSHFAGDDLLAKDKITVSGTDKSTTVSIGGLPFGQGSDGFLYDVTGRPHLLEGSTHKPLSQMEYYFIARRLHAMPKFKAIETLTELTLATREFTDQVNSGELAGADYSVDDDLSARKADSEYTIRGDSFIAPTLIQLMNLELFDIPTLFQVPRANGTPISSLLSKYSQLDLDHWQIERAMSASGNTSGAERVREHRSKLFDSARELLKKHITQNSSGALQFQYEAHMYAASPLRFNSLQSAIANEGDDSITIWRGDYAFAKALGMAPNNDPRQPAARANTRADFGKRVVPHLLQDLKALERSGVGSHYLSHTTDLSLLTGKFATKVNSVSVHLDSLPRTLAWGLESWVEGRAPGSGLMPPSMIGVAAGKILGVPGEVAKIKRGSGRTLEIESSRKAFEMKVPKNSILPGIVTLSKNHAFANEQEVHGLERVSPLSIVATYGAEKLEEAF